MDVRIGLPNEHLASGTMTEINQPMFSTGVGLLLKGYEIMEAHRREQEYEMEREEPVEEEEREEKQKNRMGIFDSLKKTITDIFEENDAKM